MTGERILIVDDDDGCLEMMKFLLRNNHYEVDIADNGNEALARFHHPDKYCLILLDIVMPPPDGIEVARILTREKFHNFLFVTALIRPQLELRCSPDLMDYAQTAIFKPFDIDDLLKITRASVGKAS